MEKLAQLQSEVRYMATKYCVWDAKIIYFYSTSTGLIHDQILANSDDLGEFVDKFVDFASYYGITQDDIIILYELVSAVIAEMGLLIPVTLQQFCQLVIA